MSSNTLAGIPFALACAGILVYCLVQLLGTLGSMDVDPSEADGTDESGRGDVRAVIVATAVLLALLARYGR